MLNIILKDLIDPSVPIKICDFEVKSNKFWQSYEMLETLGAQYPENEFSFVVGTDVLDGIQNWEKGENLLEEYEFIICKRLKYDIDSQFYPKNYRILPGFVDASSTKVKNRISNHIQKGKKLDLGICGLTTKTVIDYILEKNLYKETS